MHKFYYYIYHAKLELKSKIHAIRNKYITREGTRSCANGREIARTGAEIARNYAKNARTGAKVMFYFTVSL